MSIDHLITNRTAARRRARASGFTLIELMITIALAAILVTLGAPAFREALQNNRAAAQTNNLVAALSLARSEAVRRGAAVSVCPSSNQAACDDGGTDWSVGWIVFIPSTNPLELVRVWPATPGVQTFTGPTLVSFRGTGEATAVGTFSHVVKNCTGEQARTISVGPTGHVGAVKTACP